MSTWDRPYKRPYRCVYKSKRKISHDPRYPVEARVPEQKVDLLIAAKKKFKIVLKDIAEYSGINLLIVCNIFTKSRYCYSWEYERLDRGMRRLILDKLGLTPQEANRLVARQKQRRQEHNSGDNPQRK